MGWKPRDLITIDTFDEWRPFLLAAREARLQEVPWALDPLDFRLIGQAWLDDEDELVRPRRRRRTAADRGVEPEAVAASGERHLRVVR